MDANDVATKPAGRAWVAARYDVGGVVIYKFALVVLVVMICEIAGRVCYMSFAKPRPGGNAAYVERLLSVALFSN